MRVGKAIYLDHQASTPVDSEVLAAMTPFFAESFANPHSVDHALGWTAAQAVEAASLRVAELIGADADEMIFTSGATEANNLSLLGLGRAASGGKRRRVLLGATEHKCVLAAGRALQQQLGYSVEHLPVDAEGRIPLNALEAAMDHDVLIVSIMAVNNEIGTVQDIVGLSSVVKRWGAYFHCDAAQAPGAIDIRDAARFTDALSLSAHKMYGPKGVGGLFLRRDLHNHVEPLLYGGGQQHYIRSGTLPVPLCVGMGVAADLIAKADLSQVQHSTALLRDRLVKNLASLPYDISLNGPRAGNRHPGNASLCFRGLSAKDLLGTLQPRVAASTGSACTSGIPEPSHVLRAIGLSDEDSEASIRFSVGRLTTEADIDEASTLISEAISRLDQSAPTSCRASRSSAATNTNTPTAAGMSAALDRPSS